MARGLCSDGFLHGVRLGREGLDDWSHYPFAIPAIRGLEELDLDDDTTFSIGENGSGNPR